MAQKHLARTGTSNIGEVLDAVSADDYERVLSLAPPTAAELMAQGPSKDLWVVQEAWCSAAHAVDDYPLMTKVSRLMFDTAKALGNAEYEVCALLELSIAQRCTLDFDKSVHTAYSALERSADLPTDSPFMPRLYQVLMASLVESGAASEAWKFHAKLAQALQFIVEVEEQAKGYWTLGNLAFMVGEPEQGVQYHQEAAGLLVPSNNMLLWARFNRASAEFRLRASILDDATRDCLKRARLAFKLIEPGDLDQMGLALTESRLLAVDQQPAAAFQILENFYSSYRGNPHNLLLLLNWWAELLEQQGDSLGAQEKRFQASQLAAKEA